MLWVREFGIVLEDGFGLFSGKLDQLDIGQLCGSELLHAGLASAKEISGPPLGQVEFGQFEAIIGRFHGFESLIILF